MKTEVMVLTVRVMRSSGGFWEKRVIISEDLFMESGPGAQLDLLSTLSQQASKYIVERIHQE